LTLDDRRLFHPSLLSPARSTATASTASFLPPSTATSTEAESPTASGSRSGRRTAARSS